MKNTNGWMSAKTREVFAVLDPIVSKKKKIIFSAALIMCLVIVVTVGIVFGLSAINIAAAYATWNDETQYVETPYEEAEYDEVQYEANVYTALYEVQSNVGWFYIPAPPLPPNPVFDYTIDFVYPILYPEPEDEIPSFDNEYAIPLLNRQVSTARCSFKSWMDWRSITYRNSRQWRMQQIAYTCEDGFRRVDGLYMVALGTYFLYGGVGDVFDITLSSGITFRAVVGDIKSDRHTDASNRFHLSDGSVVEFIVDRQVMCRYVLMTRGDISFAGFPGEVVQISRLPGLFIEV